MNLSTDFLKMENLEPLCETELKTVYGIGAELAFRQGFKMGQGLGIRGQGIPTPLRGKECGFNSARECPSDMGGQVEFVPPYPPILRVPQQATALASHSGTINPISPCRPKRTCPYTCAKCGRYFHTLPPKDLHEANCIGGPSRRKGAKKRREEHQKAKMLL